MADQLIYLVETITAAMKGNEPECVSDSGLATKLGEGFEIRSTLPSKKVTIGKKVSVTPMILRRAGGPANALVTQEPDHRPRDNNFHVISRDDRGGGGMLSVVMDKLSTAIASLGDGASHLGAPRNHSMPGMTIVSGELVSKAWDAGMNAARSGQLKSSCPFPPLSDAATRWLQGWNKGAAPYGAVDPQALITIERDACELALSLGEDDEVNCVYRVGSEEHGAWMRGFKSGGGKVR